MRFELNTEIRFPTGERAGFLRKVVLDQNDGVTGVVMATDELMSRQVVVPAAMLSEGAGGVTNINCTPDEIANLNEYSEERVPVAGDGWEVGKDVSAMGEVFPGATYEPIMPIIEVPNLPEGSISISQGTEIMCLDDRWGVVEQVLTDAGGHTSAFVGRPDNMEEPPRLIPIQLVQETDTYRVNLSCGISELPNYTQAITQEIADPEEA